MESLDNSLEIPVTYKREEFSFPAEFIMSGYTHKIQVEVNGLLIIFEPDEERKYRALLNEEQLGKGTKIDIGLLQAIAEVIEYVVK